MEPVLSHSLVFSLYAGPLSFEGISSSDPSLPKRGLCSFLIANVIAKHMCSILFFIEYQDWHHRKANIRFFFFSFFFFVLSISFSQRHFFVSMFAAKDVYKLSLQSLNGVSD